MKKLTFFYISEKKTVEVLEDEMILKISGFLTKILCRPNDKISFVALKIACRGRRGYFSISGNIHVKAKR